MPYKEKKLSRRNAVIYVSALAYSYPSRGPRVGQMLKILPLYAKFITIVKQILAVRSYFWQLVGIFFKFRMCTNIMA